MSIGEAINSFRDGLNSWLSVILKAFLIIGLVLFILWIGTSFVVNCTEDVRIKNEPPISKAQYEFKLYTTGEILLAHDFDQYTDQEHDTFILHGFYRVLDNKWQYQEDDIVLEEKYFGNIEYRMRE